MPPRRAATAKPDKGKGKAVDLLPPPPPAPQTTKTTVSSFSSSSAPPPPPPPPVQAPNTTAPAPAPEQTQTSTPPTTNQPLFFDGGGPSDSDSDLPPAPTSPPHYGDGDGDGDGNSTDDASHLSDSDPDSDPVITTYDIHLTTTLTPHLHLFQYPVRSSNLPYTRQTSTCPISARIKPHAGAIELDVPINTTRNYDQEKGRRWGDALRKSRLAREARISGRTSSTSAPAAGKRRRTINADDYNNDSDTDNHANDDDNDDNNNTAFMSFSQAKSTGRVLTTQTLSAHLHPQSTAYMVGVFRHKQLHLTPIHSCLQLRPQFPHIDTAAALEKDMQRALRIDASGGPPQPQARALQTTVKQVGEEGLGGGGDALRALRREEGEEWVGMRWVDQDSEAAWEVFEGMFLPGSGDGGAKKGGGDADEEGDVQMEDGGEKGAVAHIKAPPHPPRLKTVITGAEYLQLLAAPRVDRD